MEIRFFIWTHLQFSTQQKTPSEVEKEEDWRPFESEISEFTLLNDNLLSEVYHTAITPMS